MIRLRRVQKTIGVKMGGEVLLAISPSRLMPLHIGVDSVRPGLMMPCQNLCFGNQQLTAQISIVYRKSCQGKWLISRKMQIAFGN
jgi:hypothetical protein